MNLRPHFKQILVLIASLFFIVIGCLAQVAANLSPVPKMTFLDSAGNPLSGGKLYTYQAGGSTPQTTYSDQGVTPHANPIILDSAGRATIYLAQANYRFVLTDSADVQQWTQDNVNNTSILSSANTWTSLQTFSGGVSYTGAAPVVVGDTVWPGTATGFCSNPAAAPNFLVFTPAAPNASTIGAATYDVRYTLGNEAGETLQSATRTVTIAAGEALQIGWDVGAGDYAFTTGCPKMRVYVKSGANYYLQTPWTRKVNLATIARVDATDTVTATTSGAHGMVPGDLVTIAGVLCGGGACTPSFAGDFTLLDGTLDPVGGGNGTLIWSQNAADLTGDAATGQMSDVTVQFSLGGSWWYAASNYGAPTAMKGPTFNVAFATSGTEPPATSTAVIPALQVALNRTHSRLGTGDPDYFHGRKLKVRLPEKYTVTLTTPLVLYETVIDGVHPNAEQAGQNSPLITSAIANPALATVMVMGPNVELNGVNVVNTHINGHAMMVVAGAHYMNNFKFRNGYIGADATASATGAALRLRNMPISFNWRFEDMNFSGGKWSVWSDRTILSRATVEDSRFNCNSLVTGSGAFRILGGPDIASRATNDSDGITSSVWHLINSPSQSCTGTVADLTNSKLILEGAGTYMGGPDHPTAVGTDAIVDIRSEFWSVGSSAGQGIEVLNNAVLYGATNAAATIQATGIAPRIIVTNGSIQGSSASNFFLNGGGSNAEISASGRSIGFTCDANETITTTARMTNVNLAANSLFSNCIGMGDPTTNTLNANHQLNGLILLQPPSVAGLTAANAKYFGIGKGFTNVRFYNGTPQTAANLFMEWSGGSTGGALRILTNNGTTNLFHVDSAAATNRINLFAPGFGFAGWVNIANAVGIAWAGTAAAVRGIELNSSNIFILGEGTANEVRPRTTLTPFGSTGARWKPFFQDTSLRRVAADAGTALVAGDFALSGGWGAGSAVSGVIGTDAAWTMTVTAAGVPGANPTVTLTFKDGTWTNSPICQAKWNGGTGAAAFVQDAPTATTNVMTFLALPVAASTYILTGTCTGR